MSAVKPESRGSRFRVIARSAAGAVLQISRLGQRNDLGEDLDLLDHAGPLAEQHVDDFFEIEQPKRQLQISRRQHLRLVAEAIAVFVVRVDQKDAQIRPGVENLSENDRNAARLADAGRAKDGKMPADEMVDVDVDVDIRILL